MQMNTVVAHLSFVAFVLACAVPVSARCPQLQPTRRRPLDDLQRCAGEAVQRAEEGAVRAKSAKARAPSSTYGTFSAAQGKRLFPELAGSGAKKKPVQRRGL